MEDVSTGYMRPILNTYPAIEIAQNPYTTISKYISSYVPELIQ